MIWSSFQKKKFLIKIKKKKKKKKGPQTRKPHPKISATFQAGQKSIRAGVFYWVGLRVTPTRSDPTRVLLTPKSLTTTLMLNQRG